MTNMLPTMLTALAFSLAFAALNRARGSKLFGKTSSTTVARTVSTLGMAVTVMLIAENDQKALLMWTWASIYIALLPGWGKYAGAAVGAPLNQSEREFPPVDWIMARLPISNPRLWGTVAMCLRMTLAAPCIAGIAHLTGGSPLWGAGTLLLGIPYLLCGYAFGPGRGWSYAEYCAGAMLGLICFNATV